MQADVVHVANVADAAHILQDIQHDDVEGGNNAPPIEPIAVVDNALPVAQQNVADAGQALLGIVQPDIAGAGQALDQP